MFLSYFVVYYIDTFSWVSALVELELAPGRDVPKLSLDTGTLNPMEIRSCHC